MGKRTATSKKPAPAPSVAAAGTARGCVGDGSCHNGSRVPEDDIRVRAYEKWEAAGCPGGDGVAFWLEAERELRTGT
jgi:hypothetical protein